MSFADGVTLRGNDISAKNAKEVVWRSDVFRISNLVFEGNKVNGKDVIPFDRIEAFYRKYLK